jgi:hypothetical protein
MRIDAFCSPRSIEAHLYCNGWFTRSHLAGLAFMRAFGRHAYVFVFGEGYEGNTDYKYLKDWGATPVSTGSRIVDSKTKS